MRIEYCKSCLSEISTTEEMELNLPCYACRKKHAQQFTKNNADFKPEVVAKLKENGY